jgi:quinol monooxygenase YgiN
MESAASLSFSSNSGEVPFDFFAPAGIVRPAHHLARKSRRGSGIGRAMFRHEETMMPVTVILELRLKPESVTAARDAMRRALQDTRAFEGNLGTDVLVDEDDEAHWLIYERWDTVEHDEAYRSFRAGEGRLTELPPLLAAPPVKTRYRTTDV